MPKIEIPFFLRRGRVEFRGAIIGMKGPNIGIEPWAVLEDVR